MLRRRRTIGFVTIVMAGVLAILATGAVAGPMPKYKVTAKADAHTDFSRLRTYVWEVGWQSFDLDAHEQIVAAVDRELAARGFTKGTPGASDVSVVYGVVRRTDLDLKSKERSPEGLRPTFPVASLVVLLRDATTRKELFRAHANARIELEPGKVAAMIDSQVAQMFARYPVRR